MKLVIVQWPRVERDLTEHYAYIAQDKVEPAERLLMVAEEAFERLARNPSLGTVWRSLRPHLKGIHFYPMPAPYRSYIVFYRATEAQLEVIAVLHGARDLEGVLQDIVE
jgi:toxin ParE1/3/4